MHFHSGHTHVDSHPCPLIHTLIRLTLRKNTRPSYPPRSKCPKGVPRLPLWLLGRRAGLGWAPGILLPSLLPALPSPLCPADNLKKRIANINRYLTYNLYSNVCRSLFEKHKLMFAFLLCARIMMNQGKINQVRDGGAASSLLENSQEALG